MSAVLLAALILSADADPAIVKRVEQYAEGVRKDVIKDGKVVRAPLKLPDDPITFLVYVEADKPRINSVQKTPSRRDVRKVIIEAQKSTSIQWHKPNPKSDDPAGDFAKWATGFIGGSRKVFVTQFEGSDQAKHFIETWLSLISRNSTGLRVKQLGETVIWGTGDLVERL